MLSSCLCHTEQSSKCEFPQGSNKAKEQRGEKTERNTTKTANIIINAKGGPSIKIYVGSVVGYADESVFETELTYDNTYNTFVMETDIAPSGSGNNPPSLKVGAVVGNDATIGGSYYPYKNDI